jgi:hypothetical protein
MTTMVNRRQDVDRHSERTGHSPSDSAETCTPLDYFPAGPIPCPRRRSRADHVPTCGQPRRADARVERPATLRCDMRTICVQFQQGRAPSISRHVVNALMARLAASSESVWGVCRRASTFWRRVGELLLYRAACWSGLAGDLPERSSSPAARHWAPSSDHRYVPRFQGLG